MYMLSQAVWDKYVIKINGLKGLSHEIDLSFDDING